MDISIAKDSNILRLVSYQIKVKFGVMKYYFLYRRVWKLNSGKKMGSIWN